MTGSSEPARGTRGASSGRGSSSAPIPGGRGAARAPTSPSITLCRYAPRAAACPSGHGRASAGTRT
eukprot:8699579-Alexandrium_andersonii.AAC.1